MVPAIFLGEKCYNRFMARIKDSSKHARIKQLSFGRLAVDALPEMWSFQFWVGMTLTVITSVIDIITEYTVGAGGVMTSANLKESFLSWRMPVVLALILLLSVVYIVFEIFAQIHLTDDILSGRPAGFRREIRESFRALKKFMTPSGIGVMLFILIVIPLCGLGFSVSLTESFYIPNFIMEGILAERAYTVMYFGLILLMMWVSLRYVFTVHGVIIDDLTPRQAMAKSSELIRSNRFRFIGGMIKTFIILFFIKLLVSLIFVYIPELVLNGMSASYDPEEFINVFDGHDLTEAESDHVVFRIGCIAAVAIGSFIESITSLLCGAYLMLKVSWFYLTLSGGGSDKWPERPKHYRYISKVFLIIMTFAVILVFSVAGGVAYNQVIDTGHEVGIIAHRAGGSLASENSLEGLDAAIEHGCLGSETDVQRTKDNHYIINHDNDFKRLTGVAKAPKDMTLKEIRKLRIKDTTGSGAELKVPTIGQMLDRIKDKEILYIELKGVTADRQMVDDLVEIIERHDCRDDVVLISLNYDVISYAETTYPEYETGTLFFASLGDVTKMNCDLLIMEEETATDERISNIHKAGKKAIVWTVNTETSMTKFLNSKVDAVITDKILLAEKVQARIDNRNEYQRIHDAFSSK